MDIVFNVYSNYILKIRYLFGIILFISSCSGGLDEYGSLTFYNQYSAKNNFRFAVYDEFLQKSNSSKLDQEYQPVKITKRESKLLRGMMKQQQKCFNEKGKVHFQITYRQDRVYDMTFFNLIKENYRVRPVTPVLYFGNCLA